MLTCYQFPKAHWVHLRTSNPIESPFAALRLRIDAAKRFKRVENATAIIWKMLLVAQQRFRRLNAPELLTEVYHGATFVNGVRVMERTWEVAARLLFAHLLTRPPSEVNCRKKQKQTKQTRRKT